MLNEAQYLKIVRASAAYDLVVTIGFATPWTLAVLVAVVGIGHNWLGLPGIVPDLDTWQVLFANLMGSVVVVWSLVRLHLRLAVLGRYDMAARWLFAAWQVNALLNGASWVLIVFLVAEVAFGILQALPYRKDETD
jgi:hypothetical protein